MIRDWHAAIADADLADGITAVAYTIAALVSARAARCATLNGDNVERRFWRLSAVMLVLLGINELLDLQALLTSIGRAHASANGWYESRRSAQYAFGVFLVAIAVLAGTALLCLTRHAHTTVKLALVGLVFIGLFVLLRAASFHHLTEIFNRGAPQFTWGSLQEAAGIAIVGTAAALYPRRSRDTAAADLRQN